MTEFFAYLNFILLSFSFRSPTIITIIRCVTLWRDPAYLERFKGRIDLLDYAEEQGIPVTASKKHSYSEDENLVHISYESGELEDPAFPGHEHECVCVYVAVAAYTLVLLVLLLVLALLLLLCVMSLLLVLVLLVLLQRHEATSGG